MQGIRMPCHRRCIAQEYCKQQNHLNTMPLEMEFLSSSTRRMRANRVQYVFYCFAFFRFFFFSFSQFARVLAANRAWVVSSAKTIECTSVHVYAVLFVEVVAAHCLLICLFSSCLFFFSLELQLLSLFFVFACFISFYAHSMSLCLVNCIST